MRRKVVGVGVMQKEVMSVVHDYLDRLDDIYFAAMAEAKLDSLDNDLVEVTRDKLIMIASDVIDEVIAKNADYNDSWQRQGIQGTLCRIADKLCRIETLADGRDALVVGEKLSETLLDNIGYSLLALLWLKERGGF